MHRWWLGNCWSEGLSSARASSLSTARVLGRIVLASASQLRRSVVSQRPTISFRLCYLHSRRGRTRSLTLPHFHPHLLPIFLLLSPLPSRPPLLLACGLPAWCRDTCNRFAPAPSQLSIGCRCPCPAPRCTSLAASPYLLLSARAKDRRLVIALATAAQSAPSSTFLVDNTPAIAPSYAFSTPVSPSKRNLTLDRVGTIESEHSLVRWTKRRTHHHQEPR